MRMNNSGYSFNDICLCDYENYLLVDTMNITACYRYRIVDGNAMKLCANIIKS
jgi:hypothetical protein